MFRLIRLTGPKIGEEVPLDLPATIGRHPRASVVIRDSRSSRYHCRVVQQGRGAALEDLKSRNGTYLNDERTDGAPLVHGDRIRIGETVLLLVDGRGAEWVGRSLGEFEILSLTDRFAIAAEFLARQPSMEREVSLILLDDDLPAGERDAAMVRARLAGKIKCPAALRVHDIVEAEGRTLIIGEPPTMPGLRGVFEDPARRAPQVLVDVAAALGELSVRARDVGTFLSGLDSRRIFVTPQGELKVAHVGMGAVLGGAAHLAPEEREGKSPTPAADTYAVGSLLREAAEGVAALEGALARATKDDPRERPSTPADLAQDLREALRGTPRRQVLSAGARQAEDAAIEAGPGPGLRFLRGVAFTLFLASLFFLSSQVTRLILTRP